MSVQSALRPEFALFTSARVSEIGTPMIRPCGELAPEVSAAFDDVVRMLSSKSATSSKIPDQLRMRWSNWSSFENVALHGVDLRGPEPNAHTAVSVHPNGWH